MLFCLRMAGQRSELMAAVKKSQSNSVVLSEWPSYQALLFHQRMILILLTSFEGGVMCTIPFSLCALVYKPYFSCFSCFRNMFHVYPKLLNALYSYCLLLWLRYYFFLPLKFQFYLCFCFSHSDHCRQKP